MGPGEEPRNSTAKTGPRRWERRGHRCPRQTLLCPPEGPRSRRTSCTPITYHSDSGPPASRLKKPRCTGVSRCGKVQLGFRPSPTGLQSPAPLCRETSPLPRPRSLRGLSRPPSEPPAQRAAAHPGCPRPHLQGADFRLPALTPGPHPSPLPVMTTAPSSPRHEQGQETTVGVAFPYAVGITGAFENLWGAGNPLLDTSTFGYHFGVMHQGHSSPIIPSLDTLRVYENLRERLQRKGEVVKGAPSPAGSPNPDRPPSALPRGWLQLWPRRWRWNAEARFPPSHCPREHEDHTATPPGPRLKDHGALVAKSATISLPVCPFYRPPTPRPDTQENSSCPGQTSRSPGATCPLLGDSAANQAGHAWHWPLSLTQAAPTPTTTQGHICFGKQPVLSY